MTHTLEMSFGVANFALERMATKKRFNKETLHPDEIRALEDLILTDLRSGGLSKTEMIDVYRSILVSKGWGSGNDREKKQSVWLKDRTITIPEEEHVIFDSILFVCKNIVSYYMG